MLCLSNASGVRQSVRLVVRMRLLGYGVLWVLLLVVLWIGMDILLVVVTTIACPIQEFFGLPSFGCQEGAFYESN